MVDVRCENGIKFGEIRDGILEVKCRSSRCGHGRGTVVFHRFSLETGELLSTQAFKDIASREEGKQHDNTSLRSA